jgi:hypothetical protein
MGKTQGKNGKNAITFLHRRQKIPPGSSAPGGGGEKLSFGLLYTA